MVDVAEVLNKFGIPWPDADTDNARKAAGAWTALGQAAQGALDEGNNAANVLCANNTGQAMAAFSQYWDEFGGSGKSANLTVLVGACNALAKACTQFADEMDDLKSELETKAAEIGGALIGGGLLTVFTAGLSDAAGGTIVAALVPEAVASVEAFGVSVGTIATTVLSGGVMGLLDETISQVSGMVAGAVDGDKAALTPSLSDDVSAFVVGSFAAPLASGLTSAAKGGAGEAADGVVADANIVAPQLPKLLSDLPTAVDTPAGKALVDLVSKTSAQDAVGTSEEKDSKLPAPDEVVGAMLDAKIESVVESAGE